MEQHLVEEWRAPHSTLVITIISITEQDTQAQTTIEKQKMKTQTSKEVYHAKSLFGQQVFFLSLDVFLEVLLESQIITRTNLISILNYHLFSRNHSINL